MSKTSKNIRTEHAPRPVGAYPHARRVGNLLFLSGIGPRQAGTDRIPGNVYDDHRYLQSYDIVQQTKAVFDNVRKVLEASGAHWEDLVDVTVFLTDLPRDFRAYNTVWEEYFPDHAKAPCRTTVGIDTLPTPIAIELKCVAVLPEGK